jgi:hypothetical protein
MIFVSNFLVFEQIFEKRNNVITFEKKNAMIAPSILSADFTRLADAIEMLNQQRADYIHLDIMDGICLCRILPL